MVGKTLLFTSLFSLSLGAGELQTNKIMCEPSLIYQCTEQKCEKIEIVNIEGVQYFEIDTQKKTLTGKIGRSDLDIEHIISRHGNVNSFVFFGTHTDSQFDWVLRINKKSGKMILVSTNAELNGFTIFGSCKWEREK